MADENIENNTIVNNTLIEENVTNLTKTEIGLIGIASFFLFITIIFFINFIKHQQKMNEKVSK